MATTIDHISRESLRQKIESGADFALVDALPPMSYATSHLPGAINLPPESVDGRAQRRIPDRSTEVVVYCSDVECDSSVIVVPLRGHTPGSVGIFVNLSPTRRLFYVGDSVDDERGFEERVGKSLILRDSDNDMALANQIVGRLSELHEKLPQLAIIPAHGRSAYKKFFPGGPLTCVSGQ